MSLKDINTIHIRAEDFVKNHKNEFDIVTCRAVSRLNNLLKYTVPLVKKNASTGDSSNNSDCVKSSKSISQASVMQNAPTKR